MRQKNKKLPINQVINIFSNKNIYKSYLLVEKEFALAQGELNIIPKKASIEISKKCTLNILTLNL